jgi:hypothetical protein
MDMIKPILLLLVIVMLLSSCQPGGNETEDPLDFRSHYVRVQWSGGAESPPTVITSVADLDWFMGKYRNLGPFTIQPDIGEDYTEDFFADHYLVILSRGETSGSIRHRVENVASNGLITVQRLEPDIGTMDMAHWLIIIALEQGIKPAHFTAVFK